MCCEEQREVYKFIPVTQKPKRQKKVPMSYYYEFSKLLMIDCDIDFNIKANVFSVRGEE